MAITEAFTKNYILCDPNMPVQDFMHYHSRKFCEKRSDGVEFALHFILDFLFNGYCGRKNKFSSAYVSRDEWSAVF